MLLIHSQLLYLLHYISKDINKMTSHIQILLRDNNKVQSHIQILLRGRIFLKSIQAFCETSRSF